MRTPIVLFALTLVLAGPAAAEDPSREGIDTPVFDEVYRLRRELDVIQKAADPASEKKRHELRQKLDKLRTPLRDEVKRLNARMYETRQAELVRRARPDIPSGRKLGFTVLDYPLVNGSTSAHPLGMLAACRLLGVEYHWTNRYSRPRSYPGGSAIGFRFTLADYLVQYRLLAKGEVRHAGRLAAIVNQQIAVHHGTHGGYVALTERKADLCLLARRPSAAERNAAESKGVTFLVKPVALDAFVFIAHRANPVRGLTTTQLKGIYAGRITGWKEIGGRERTIEAYQRNETSGSQQLMLSVFMKETSMKKPGRGLMRHSMRGPFSALTEDQDGIAYSVYFYEHFMAASPYTRALAVDGVEPTSETIRSRTYPYVTEVFAVIRRDEPPDSNARKLSDWLLTEEGQAVVAESGYVPLPAD